MTTRSSRNRSWRATLENLLVVWLASAIGPGVALALSWFGVG
jgi:hypothetical protein